MIEDCLFDMMKNKKKKKNKPPKNNILRAITKVSAFVNVPNHKDAVSFYMAAFGVEQADCFGLTHNNSEPLFVKNHMNIPGMDLYIYESEKWSNVSNGSYCFYVKDEEIEAAMNMAVSAGAVAVDEVSRSFADGRSVRIGRIRDPCGVCWRFHSPPPSTKQVFRRFFINLFKLHIPHACHICQNL